jgi:hypothetical protein
MKKIILIAIAVVVLFCFNVVIAQEKPLIIKGLYIGMDINAARNTIEKLLGKDWRLSSIGETYKILSDYRFGNEQIFGRGSGGYLQAKFSPDEKGFAITRNDSYEGYVSTDASSNKVTRITFGEVITDYIFATEKIPADDLVEQFRKTYNLPEWSWVAFGWTYSSPKGYVITIKTDKLIDIKKEEGEAKAKLDKRNIKLE